MITHSIDDAAWASPWRARRVGEKVALSLALVLTALLTPAWPGSLAVAVISVALILGPARIRASLLLAVTLLPLGFLVVGALPIAIHFGTDGWGLGPLRVTQEGLAAAAGLLAHGIAGTLAIMVLATTTPMVDLLTWLRTLRIPDPILEIAALTYRLLFVLLSTTMAVLAAQRMRLGAEASVTRRWAAMAATTGSIMLRTWDRTTRLQRGLEGRGYEDSLRTLAPARPRSWAFIAMTGACVAAVWLLSWGLT